MPDYIKKENFSTAITSKELYFYDSGGGSGNWKIYMFAPCWNVHVKCVKNFGSWSREFSVTVWVYDGTEFKQVYYERRKPGQFDSGTYNIYFYHNWPGVSQEGDNPNLHLYKINVYFEELYAKTIDIEYGGYGASNQNWKNKKIYGAHPVSYEYFWLQNGSWQDDSAKSASKTSLRRGTKITHNNEEICCYTEDRR